jgi:hypothetical protein
LAHSSPNVACVLLNERDKRDKSGKLNIMKGFSMPQTSQFGSGYNHIFSAPKDGNIERIIISLEAQPTRSNRSAKKLSLSRGGAHANQARNSQ